MCVCVCVHVSLCVRLCVCYWLFPSLTKFLPSWLSPGHTLSCSERICDMLKTENWYDTDFVVIGIRHYTLTTKSASRQLPFFLLYCIGARKKFTKPLRPKVCQYASVSIQITRAFITRLRSLFPITVTSHERHGGVLNHSPLTFLPRNFRLTRKPQSSYYSPFVRGIHRWSLYSLHKGQ